MTEEKDLKMPEPAGYRILIAIPKLDQTYENTSIARPEQFAKKEEMASVVGLVVKLGPLAYKDEEKFPDGPWCKEGDYIMMRSYSGTRFKISGKKGEQEFRLINDDTVEAVVDDPRGITRA